MKSLVLICVLVCFFLCSIEAAAAPMLRVTYPPDRAVSADQWIAVCGIVSRDTIRVQVNGVSAHVSAGTFLSRNVQLGPGQNRIVISASDREGNSRTKELAIVYDPSYYVPPETSRIRQLINRREMALFANGKQTEWTTPAGTAGEIIQMRSAMERWHEVFYSPLRDDRPWVPIPIPENGSWKALPDGNVGLADVAAIQHTLDRLSWWIKLPATSKASHAARVLTFCAELIPPHYLSGEATVTHRQITPEKIEHELASVQVDAETRLNVFAHITPRLSPPPLHLLSSQEAKSPGSVTVSNVSIDLDYGRALIPLFLDKATKAAALLVSSGGNTPSSWSNALDARLLMSNFDTIMLKDSLGNGQHFAKINDDYVTTTAEALQLSRTESGIFLLSDPSGARFDFDCDGILKQITDPGGRITLLSYNPAGQLSKTRDLDGNRVEFSYSIYGQLLSITVNDRIYTIATDKLGRLERVLHEDKDVISVEYDTAPGAGRVNAIARAISDRISLEYDARGRVTSLKTSSGTDTIKYGDNGKTVLIRLADGEERLFVFDALRYSWREDKPNESNRDTGSEKRAAEVPAIDISRHPKGNSTTSAETTVTPLATFSRSDVQRISYVNHLGQTAIFECVVSEEDNKKSENALLPKGRLVRFIAPMNKVTQFAYDTKGNLAAITDPEGNRFAFQYDESNHTVACTDPSGNRWLVKYMPLVPVTERMGIIGDSDANGAMDHSDLTTAVRLHFSGENAGPVPLLTASPIPMPLDTLAYQYDFFDKSVRAYYPFTPPIRYAYSVDGKRLPVQDLTGQTTTHRYRVLKRFSEHFAGLGHVAAIHWAEGLLPLSLTDPSGGTTRFRYDESGRLISVTDPLGNTETCERDERGLVTAFTNRRGATTRFSYDEAQRLMEIIDPLKNRILYSYNGSGHLARIATNQGTLAYEYDNAGRVAIITNPLGHKTHLTYDNQSRLITVMDAEKRSTGYEYDDKERLTAIVDPLGDKIRLAYRDDVQPKAIIDPTRQRVQLAYDSTGNLVSCMEPSGNTVTMRYDSRGNVVQFVDTTKFDFTYDAFDRLTLVQQDGKTIMAIEHDDWRRRRTVRLPDSRSKGQPWQSIVQYDKLYRPIERSGLAGENVKFKYDEVGNLVSVLAPSEKRTTFEYDLADRLVTVKSPDKRPVRLAYDASGNRTMLIDTHGRMTTFAYDQNNRPISMVDPALRMTKLVYDNVGHTTSISQPNGEIIRYDYDKRGLPVQITLPEQEDIRFQYDAVGSITRMLSKSADISFQYHPRQPVKVTNEHATGIFRLLEDKGILFRSVVGSPYGNKMMALSADAPYGRLVADLMVRIRRVPVPQLRHALEEALPPDVLLRHVSGAARAVNGMDELSRIMLREFIPSVPDPWRRHEQPALEFTQLLSPIRDERDSERY